MFPSEGNSDGCSPLSWDHFKQFLTTRTPDSDTSNFPLFVMVDRGRCSNPTKVRNVENFGGAIALIVDYKPEDVNSFVMTDYGGSGHSLVTPGMLVDYFSSLQIKMVLEQSADVIIRASLTIAKPDNSVEIGLLYSSSLDLDA